MINLNKLKVSKIGFVIDELGTLYCENCGCYLQSVEDKCKNCKKVYTQLLKGGLKKRR